MVRKGALLALAMAASAALACSLGQGPPPTPVVETPEPPQPTPLAPTTTPAPPGATATPAPATAVPAPEPTRIRFEPGATSAAVTGQVAAGESQRYVLRAQAGQTMEVVVTSPLHDVLLAIWSEGGRLLKGPGDGQSYWRDKLPASQDYVVEIISSGEPTEFALTVTIPPLETPDGEQVYRNTRRGFEMRYTPQFVVGVPAFDPETMRTTVEVSFHLVGSAYYSGTNLSEAAVIVGVSGEEGIVAVCETPRLEAEEPLGQVEIDAASFRKSTFTGVAAGHAYEQITYRAACQDRCYEIVLLIHSTNISAYTPGTVTEFDREAVLQTLEEVLFTFRFLE